MKIKLFSLIAIFVFSLPFISSAQETRGGIRNTIQTNANEEIFYTFSTQSNQNIYNNHYSIYLKKKASKADTIYTVDLDFDRTNNSIKISQFDWTSDQYHSKTVEFRPLSALIKTSDAKPIYCVKNYVFNDTLISLTKDDKASIFFTIADTISPYIFLHHLESFNGKHRFDLDKFRKSYLTPHLIHSQDYWQWKKSNTIDSTHIKDSIVKAERAVLQVKINKETDSINADKDYELEILTKKQEDVKKLPDTLANIKSQELFTRRMDKIFSEYLSSTQCSNTEITGSYKFYVYPNQPVSIVKQPPIFLMDWRVAQQFTIIDTLIKKIPLEKTEMSICTDDPYSIIFQKHLLRSKSLKLDVINLHCNFDSVFKPTLDSVQLEIKNICNSKIPITTTYTYPFTYISKSEWGIWKLRNKKIKVSKDSLIDTKKNIDQFYAERPKAKNGKYDVRLNTTILNNRTYGPDLDSVNLKYKYLTRVGFNIGTFAPEGQFMIGTDESVGEIFFWNISFIYHHIGVFGGSKSGYGTNSFPHSDTASTITYLKNYSEGGLYLAPGKFFYFKLGIANYSTIDKTLSGSAIKESETIIMPIVGGSLMFPVFQIEAGYNFAIKYPYLMAGFNIPINF